MQCRGTTKSISSLLLTWTIESKKLTILFPFQTGIIERMTKKEEKKLLLKKKGILLLQVCKLMLRAIKLMLATVSIPSHPLTVPLIVHWAVMFNFSFSCHLTMVAKMKD